MFTNLTRLTYVNKSFRMAIQHIENILIMPLNKFIIIAPIDPEQIVYHCCLVLLIKVDKNTHLLSNSNKQTTLTSQHAKSQTYYSIWKLPRYMRQYLQYSSNYLSWIKHIKNIALPFPLKYNLDIVRINENIFIIYKKASP